MIGGRSYDIQNTSEQNYGQGQEILHPRHSLPRNKRIDDIKVTDVIMSFI